MIDCITWETAHLYGDAWASHHRLRYKLFVERQQWDVPNFNQLEYDQYDTPAAVYLLWRDNGGSVRATTRLVPTSRPYMLQEVFPELAASGPLPNSPDIWEATRIGVDRDMEPGMRTRAAAELIAGCLEYGLRNNIGRYVFVMPMAIIKSLLIRAGCSPVLLGEPKRIGRQLTAAAEIVITSQQLERVRDNCGLHNPVISDTSVTYQNVA
jgi:acyl homoserine lactone synthase